MKRVRKEIRDLSDQEWYHVVRALWIMKVTTDTDGKFYYGPNFISYDSMISKHMIAGCASTILYRYHLRVFEVFFLIFLIEWQHLIPAAIRRTSDRYLAYSIEPGCFSLRTL